MLEIIAFLVTFGGMLIYGFGHAFAYANQNRVIRKTVENVVDEKLQRSKGSKLSVSAYYNNELVTPTDLEVSASQKDLSAATLDFNLFKDQVISENWNFAKKTVVEAGEDHTVLFEGLKNQHDIQQNFESTILTNEIDTQLEKLFNDVSRNSKSIHDIGPNVSKLITSSIQQLEVNKTNIIVGKVVNGFLDDTLELSNVDGLVCGKDDLTILKGVLLPNNTFRVITTEDADTYENGYSDVFSYQNKEVV